MKPVLVAALLLFGITLIPTESAAFPRRFLFRQRLAPSCPPFRFIDAQPAPQWPMFGGTPARNMANRVERDLATEWDATPGKRKNIRWIAELGSKTYGSPVIAGGRIFIGTNNENPRDKSWIKKDRFTGRLAPVDLGVLMCFRESDGAFLWQAVHEKLSSGQVNDWPREGICSSPVVEGDRLYYVSNRCEVVCANTADGKAIWKLDMIKEHGVFPHNMSACSPLIAGDLVMVVTANGVNEDHINIPAPNAPSFLAIDKRNGKTIWQNNAPTIKYTDRPPGVTARDHFQRLADRGDIVQHGQWSNPAYGIIHGVPQVVFPGGDGWLYSFEPRTGKLLWKFDGNPKDAVFALSRGTRCEFLATPVIHNNRVYIGVGQDPEHGDGVGHFWCIDMTRRGDVSPELRLPNDKIEKNSNSAVVWHYGGPINDVAIRKKLRRNYYFGRTLSTCAIHDGLVYVSDLGGILHCLHAETGVLQWEYNQLGELWGSPFYVDGKVYVGSDDKTICVFQHGRQMKLLAENNMEGRVRGPVIANNGVLYVATENRLVAIER